MLVLYSFIAIFIAWIWVDYYRLIDIYEKESLKYFIFTFLLGCGSVLIVQGFNTYLLDSWSFDLNGEFVNDFVYSFLKIGLVEEFAKAVPFVIMYLLFKEQFNEPIDYLAYICVSALGFSAAENALYFNKYGPDIINNRAILATVGHMFDSSLIAYGIIRYIYFYNRKSIGVLLLFFLLAALSHGFYDFWLLYEGTKMFGFIITIFYFLITISIFAVILNNALNHSSYFTYKKVVNSEKVAKRLITYYAIVFGLQFCLLLYFRNFEYASRNLRGSIFVAGFIIIVSCVRLSRFKLIKDRWHAVKIELPFSFGGQFRIDPLGSGFSVRIKGESYNEAYISVFLEEYFSLCPMSKQKTHLGKARLSFIEKKIFLYNDESYYLVKIFQDGNTGPHEYMLLRPKLHDSTMVKDIYPIVALLGVRDIADIQNPESTARNFVFKEWAFLRPLKNTVAEAVVT